MAITTALACLLATTFARADVYVRDRCDPRERGACTSFVDGSHFVGLCDGVRCNPKVSIASIREAEQGAPRGPLLAIFAALVAAGAVSWLVSSTDRRLAARALRNALTFELPTPTISRARVVARWALPPLLLAPLALLAAARASGLERAADLAGRRPSRLPLTSADLAPLTFEWLSYPPVVVERDGSSRVLLTARSVGYKPEGELVIAYDIATQTPVWSRPADEWLDLPLLLAVHDGRAAIFTGGGVVEVRDPITGNVLRSGSFSHRIRRLERAVGKPVIWVWDTWTMHRKLDLDTGKVEDDFSAGPYHGWWPWADRCSTVDDKALRTALPDLSFQRTCGSQQTGGVAIVTRGQGTPATLIAFGGSPTAIAWEAPLRGERAERGFVQADLADSGPVVLVWESCPEGPCVGAYDRASGARRWTATSRHQLRPGLALHDRAFVLLCVEEKTPEHAPGTGRHVLEVRKQETGELVGTIPP